MKKNVWAAALCIVTAVCCVSCTAQQSDKTDIKPTEQTTAPEEDNSSAMVSHTINGSKFRFALPAALEKFPLKNTDTLYFDTGISGSEFSVMGASQNCTAEFNKQQIRDIIAGKGYADLAEETVDIGGSEVVRFTAKGKYGAYLSECAFYENGDLLWVTADVPEDRADEFFSAADGVFESLEYSGDPIKTGSERFECSFFECDIPPELLKGYAAGSRLEAGCYLCSDPYEQKCRISVSAVIDGSTAEEHADETESAEKERGSCERELSGIYGQQAHHLTVKRDTDPNAKFVSGNCAEYWYFDNGSSVIEIKIETPEGMEQAFAEKTRPLLDSLTFKN